MKLLEANVFTDVCPQGVGTHPLPHTVTAMCPKSHSIIERAHPVQAKFGR